VGLLPEWDPGLDVRDHTTYRQVRDMVWKFLLARLQAERNSVALASWVL